MQKLIYLIALTICCQTLNSQPQPVDEPLSQQSWSSFGPLSQHYIAGRKEKPDAVYSILKSYVGLNANILDLGSGTGISTRQLCRNGFKNVIGVDRDLLMIKEARAANTPACIIKYIQADLALGLPFADEQFDVVTASSSFHWFCNLSSSKEVARILKPNGYYFIIGGKSRYEQSKKPDRIKENIARILQDFGVTIPNKDSALVVDILDNHGYKIIVDATVPYVDYYSKEEYLHRIQSQSKWNLVKEDQRGHVLKKIGQYLDTVVDKQGLIKKEGYVTVVLAQRVKSD